MQKNQKQIIKAIKRALIVLVLFVAVFSVVVLFTNSINVLKQADIGLIFTAALVFLLSVFIWLLTWAWIIKKDYHISYNRLLFLGFSSLFASLTPVQLGADALRALLLKEIHKIPFSKGISASMLVKGFKFLSLFVISLAVVFFFLCTTKLNPVFLILLLSGLLVVFIATALFLLPLNERLALLISNIFRKLTKNILLLEPAGCFFVQYSAYLKKHRIHFFSLAFMCILSWFFEFLAFYLSFFSFGIYPSLQSVFVLFIILAILERVPFMPRGLGFVETISYFLLSTSFAFCLLHIQ